MRVYKKDDERKQERGEEWRERKSGVGVEGEREGRRHKCRVFLIYEASKLKIYTKGLQQWSYTVVFSAAPCWYKKKKNIQGISPTSQGVSIISPFESTIIIMEKGSSTQTLDVTSWILLFFFFSFFRTEIYVLTRHSWAIWV